MKPGAAGGARAPASLSKCDYAAPRRTSDGVVNPCPHLASSPPKPHDNHRRWPRWWVPVELAGWVALLLVLGGCGQLPPLGERVESSAYTDTAGTRLGRAVAALAAAHPGRSGVLPLPEGRQAFAVRMRLADAAERSLDLQYYIWRTDLTGTLLLDALRRAADRGVRVRLLLDDNNTAGLDPWLAALDSHPHIEVRLFNPFVQRGWRWLGYLGDFARLNRRMHNKSFTADNQVTVVGGRNIGDEYFGAGQDLSFIDLDALAVGEVVSRVSADFDRYWASASAYPAAALLPAAGAQALAPLAEQAMRSERVAAAAPFLEALRRRDQVQRLQDGVLPLEWTTVRLVSDDPAKALDGGAPQDQGSVAQRLAEAMGEARRELLLVSPYFVPTDAGTAALAGLARRGVAVGVLTNSLAATDVPAVHAGYAKHRRELLAAGVRLLELKPEPEDTGPRAPGDRGLPGSSGASLHAKTFAIDRERIFIGSFNLDPRSASLNTESGFVIDSPRLASLLSEVFDAAPARAYALRLGADGDPEWVEAAADGPPRVHASEPRSALWRRALVRLLSWLPIEWLL